MFGTNGVCDTEPESEKKRVVVANAAGHADQGFPVVVQCLDPPDWRAVFAESEDGLAVVDQRFVQPSKLFVGTRLRSPKDTIQSDGHRIAIGRVQHGPQFFDDLACASELSVVPEEFGQLGLLVVGAVLPRSQETVSSSSATA